jgi:hypothetical protein
MPLLFDAYTFWIQHVWMQLFNGHHQFEALVNFKFAFRRGRRSVRSVHSSSWQCRTPKLPNARRHVSTVDAPSFNALSWTTWPLSTAALPLYHAHCPFKFLLSFPRSRGPSQNALVLQTLPEMFIQNGPRAVHLLQALSLPVRKSAKRGSVGRQSERLRRKSFESNTRGPFRHGYFILTWISSIQIVHRRESILRPKFPSSEGYDMCLMSCLNILTCFLPPPAHRRLLLQ